MRTTMTPHAAYRARATTAVPRIDLLLSLYSGAIERIDAARAATKAGQANLATAKLARAQLLVSELAAGVRPDIEPEVNVPILRLLEFVVAQLAAPADGWLYNMHFAEKGVVPLLVGAVPDKSRSTADAKKYVGRDEVIAWAYTRPDGGRGFSFTGADLHSSWAYESQRTLVLNGILWSARLPVPAGARTTRCR